MNKHWNIQLFKLKEQVQEQERFFKFNWKNLLQIKQGEASNIHLEN